MAQRQLNKGAAVLAGACWPCSRPRRARRSAPPSPAASRPNGSIRSLRSQAGELIGCGARRRHSSALRSRCSSPARLLDQIGMKRMLLGCGACFIFGPVLIIGAGTLATGMTIYYARFAGMLLSGIGWGLAEASINPLTAQLYPERQDPSPQRPARLVARRPDRRRPRRLLPVRRRLPGRASWRW